LTDIIPCYNKVQAVDKTKIRYEQKVAALLELNLISEGLADDLVKLAIFSNLCPSIPILTKRS